MNAQPSTRSDWAAHLTALLYPIGTRIRVRGRDGRADWLGAVVSPPFEDRPTAFKVCNLRTRLIRVVEAKEVIRG